MTPGFKRILVPTDFSHGSRVALDYAIALAQELDASIHLLHVIEDPAKTGVFSEVYIDVSEIRKQRQCAGQRRLNELLADVQHARVRMTDEVAIGSVAETIAEVAEDRWKDLIVMGTHGRTGVAHLLMGSVTERVIKIAPCPVTAVRDPEAHHAAEPRHRRAS